MNEPPQESPEDTSWEASSKYAQLYGPLPSSFTTFVRCCVKDSIENNNEFSKPSIFEATRFLKSPSMKAPLYFLSEQLFPEDVDSLTYIDSKDFLEWYKPMDLAIIFSTLYVCRRAERMVNEHDWGLFIEPLIQRSELGPLVGQAIPSIGISIGVIAGSMRSLALATFLIHDQKGFGQYRRTLKINKLNFDLVHETERWGCSHPQVATSMLVNFGLSSQFAHDIYNGLLTGWDGSSAVHTGSFKTKLVECWSDALIETGAQPNMTHSGDFYPKESALTQLKERSKKLINEGIQSRWLVRRKEDISPENTPKLFK